MFGVEFAYLSLALIFLRSNIVSSLHSCRDENNNSVDWFVIYKIPKIKEHSNPLVQTGEAYAFISSANEEGWILSEKSINDSTSLPGFTMKPLYEVSSNEEAENALYILYNDQPPVGNVSFTGGHTKGIVFADNSGGIWLVHSVPHYPPLPQEQQYSYPRTGLKNGQSYLCVTLPPDELERVGTQLTYNEPHIFGNCTPTALQTLYPNLTQAAQGSNVHSAPWNHMESITSHAGTVFKTFAKAPKFKKELYSDWVVTDLRVNLLVETWPNGPGHLNSSCHLPHWVENVDSVNVPVVGESFSSHKDHSKWAVSETKDEPWVCIGDINRAISQSLRGGGTVCLKDEILWQAYYNSVSSVESCPI